MRTWPSINDRCKKRPARSRLVSTRQLSLWMAVAVSAVWSTIACCSLFGATPSSDLVEPASRAQPSHADGAEIQLLQPKSIAVSKAAQQDVALPSTAVQKSKPQVRANIQKRNALYLAAKNRTNLLLEQFRKNHSRCQQYNRGEPRSATRLDSYGISGLAVKPRLFKQEENLEKKNAAPELFENAEVPAPSEAKVLTVSQTEQLVIPEIAEPAVEVAKDSLANEPMAPACDVAGPLSSVSVNIVLPEGKLPASAYAGCAETVPPIADPRLAGGWMLFEYPWSATCQCHRPLYFEEINAERYGYTPSYFFQPVISAVRFFATIPALPYKMAVERPRDCIYTLGHYRPGSCNPRRWHRLPLRLGASAVEAGIIAGLILLIP
ncbi:MAG: hypothetical protein MI725_04695 [Pirellulales bacterium]|nr:hypothetical protein [Pirellulales bacterium]